MNVNKALKEFNAYLLKEVNELKNVISMLTERNQDLKDKLKSEKKRSQNFFTEMLRAQCECDDLNHEIERLKGENAALKIKDSIFTDPKKRRKPKQEGNDHDNL